MFTFLDGTEWRKRWKSKSLLHWGERLLHGFLTIANDKLADSLFIFFFYLILFESNLDFTLDFFFLIQCQWSRNSVHHWFFLSLCPTCSFLFSSQVYFLLMGETPETIAKWMSWIPAVSGSVLCSHGTMVQNRKKTQEEQNHLPSHELGSELVS